MAFERLRNLFSSATPSARPDPSRVNATVSPSRAGGRLSVDTEQTFLTSALGFLAPMSSDIYWRNYQLDAKTLDRVAPSKLIELLADVSPDVSKALWDFLLFMNSGWEAKALRPGSETVDKRAQAALELFLKNLHGPFAVSNTLPLDVIIASLNIGVFLRGAFFAELVLDDSARLPLELATPDPATIRARTRADDVRGQVWEIGQWQGGEFIVLDRPTICYVPVHPFPGKPYGRPLAAPAIFSTLFLLGMLHDLRRVISQQGYPRLDLAIDFEKLQPPGGLDPDATRAWVNAAIKEVQDAYAVLEPDDAFIHGAAVTVNKPVGTVDASSLGKVDEIIRMIERFSVRALKSMPLLFGSNETTSETSANRQWEIHVAGIKALQHLCENILEHLLTISLQVQGIAAQVQFRFSELRAAELLRDAQVERLKLGNARQAYDNGLISQDEQALMALGKDKADQPEPREVKTEVPTPPADINADPGSQRILDPVIQDERLN